MNSVVIYNSSWSMSTWHKPFVKACSSLKSVIEDEPDPQHVSKLVELCRGSSRFHLPRRTSQSQSALSSKKTVTDRHMNLTWHVKFTIYGCSCLVWDPLELFNFQKLNWIPSFRARNVNFKIQWLSTVATSNVVTFYNVSWRLA